MVNEQSQTLLQCKAARHGLDGTRLLVSAYVAHRFPHAIRANLRWRGIPCPLCNDERGFAITEWATWECDSCDTHDDIFQLEATVSGSSLHEALIFILQVLSADYANHPDTDWEG